jgi:hypothetical protein
MREEKGFTHLRNRHCSDLMTEWQTFPRIFGPSPILRIFAENFRRFGWMRQYEDFKSCPWLN